MINISTLKFYDNGGLDLNLELVNGLWQGTVIFPKTSQYLWSSYNILLYDQFTLNGGYHIGRIQHDVINNIQLRYYFVTKNEFTTFELNGSEIKSTNINNADIDIINSYDSVINGTKKTTNINYKPHNLQLMFGGDSLVDYSENTLVIDLFNENTDEIVKIAEINCIGEIELEDEQLSMLLNNFNENITNEEYAIFYDNTINETHDISIINSKRKEKLLQLGEIRKHKFSYISLLNALKFYGYNFLKVREYWKSNGSFVLVDIIDSIQNKPSKFKTNFLQLYYPITEPNFNILNDDGTPTIKENFNVDLQNIMVKIYGLKNILETKILPQNVKILDIVGEYNIYENVSSILHFYKHRIDEYKSGIDVDIITEKQFFQIRDLKDVLLHEHNPDTNVTELLDFEQDNKFDLNLLHSKIISGDINNELLTEFDKKYETLMSYFVGGQGTSNLVGEYITISLLGFKDLKINQTYSLNIDTNINFEYLKFHPFYEIEWVITHNNYEWKSNRLTLNDDSININVILPYIGNYDVTVILYNSDGSSQIETKKDFLYINAPNIDVFGFTKDYKKIHPISFYKNIGIKSRFITINHLKENNNKIGKYPISAFNLNNYITTDLYQIAELKKMPINTKYLSINDTKFSKKTDAFPLKLLSTQPLTSFSDININEFKQNKLMMDTPSFGVIYKMNEVGDNNIKFNGEVCSFGGVSTERNVNDYIELLEETFNEFEFNPIWKYDEFENLIGIRKIFFNCKNNTTEINDFEYWTDETFNGVDIVRTNNGNMMIHVNNKPLLISPSINNIDIFDFDSFKEYKQYTNIYFGILNTTNITYTRFKWVLKLANITIKTEGNGYFQYLFKTKGIYTLTLTVWDVNGNKQVTNTNNILQII